MGIALMSICASGFAPMCFTPRWLVALSRNGSNWREAQRERTDESGLINCALSDSRVLIGQ